MRIHHRSYKRRVVGVVGTTLLAVAAVVLWSHGVKVRASQSGTKQAEPHDVVSQMVNYTIQGRYDDAIQIGLQSLQTQPSDEVIYEGIATTYLIRAQKDSELREQWVGKAVSYTEKALALNSRDRDVAGLHIFQDARSFELAGDLSAAGKCIYYERARKFLEDRVPLLQGEHLALEGKTYPLAPLRYKNEKTLAGLKGKATKAGCK